MEKGNLSNKVSPSLVVIFEGAIGILKEEDLDAFLKACAEENWAKAVDLFYLHELYLRKLNDLAWRANFNVEICTWMGDEMAFFIRERLDRENVIVASVWSSTPASLARQLAYLPRIACVYDPEPAHVFTFGSKGVVLTNPNQIGRF